MSWAYRHLIRPALFLQNPERIHNRTVHALGWVGRHDRICRSLKFFLGAPPLPVDLFGLEFPNPVGLAAGMDKDAEALPAWAALGLGFTELGAVTLHPQPGNPQPRVFRAVREEAVVNRMGFNNAGAESVAQTLARWRALGRWPNHPVGMNLGKSKITPLKQAPEDYAGSLRILLPHLDFFVINVSSPNTPNLRQLQDKAALDEILAAANEVREQAVPTTEKNQTSAGGPMAKATDAKRRKPLLVKVAPDLSFDALDEIVELVGPRRVDGLIATNTTILRPDTPDAETQRIYSEQGGLSGRPLRNRSTEVIRHLFRQTRATVPIVGVGGIFNAADAWEKIRAGASLLQIYTSLVYQGPGVAKAIVKGLRQYLAREGLTEFSQAIGKEARELAPH